MPIQILGNISGHSYQPSDINLLSNESEQDNKPVKFCDTDMGINNPVVKVDISPEGLKALHGSELLGSADIKKQQEEMRFTLEHQPIESFDSRISRMMNNQIANFRKDNPEKNINVYDKGNILLKEFQAIVDEVNTGYENGSRIRFVKDDNSESGYKKLTKEDELYILEQEFERYVDIHFGEQHQKESEMVAKTMNDFQKVKQKIGLGNIRYYEPEKISDDFVDKIIKSAKKCLNTQK